LLIPQTWFTHVRVWQTVSSPGQSVNALHWTQTPSTASLQMWLPGDWLHEFPELLGLVGVPLVQTLSVQSFASTGLSASSTWLTVVPEPSHFLVWQSPALWPLVNVPGGW
jgi:hypothetical protein